MLKQFVVIISFAIFICSITVAQENPGNENKETQNST